MNDVVFEPTFAAFRAAVRPLLASHAPPSSVRMRELGEAQGALPFTSPAPSPTPDARLRLPRVYVELAERAACARAEGRWDLLYRVAFRLAHGEPDLLELPLDPDVARLHVLVREVDREVHHLHAFVRFRRVGDRMVGFVAPAHRVLRLAIDFFVRRFGDEPFTLHTPDETADWDGRTLSFGPGVPRDPAPPEPEIEDLFASYYGAVFDPARANARLLGQKLPQRFRAALPEARTIDRLLVEAPARVATMTTTEAPRPSFVPRTRSLEVLRDAAAGCVACGICEAATQTVFGEGPSDARAMLVGEQPGDREDLEGRPFVGPAGALLDDVLASIEVPRERVYVTNAVKHFKWEPRGKQRLHRSPKASEIGACRPWLDAEIEAVAPRTIVALGAVAARSFFGPSFRLHKARGRVFQTRWCERLVVTHHPAAILRMADLTIRECMRVELQKDLALALLA